MYIVEKGFLKDLIIVVQVALMQPQRCTGAIKSRHLSISRTGSSVINYPNKDIPMTLGIRCEQRDTYMQWLS